MNTAAKLDIGVITLFPQMLGALDASITGRAQQKGLLTLQYWNPRQYTADKRQTVDDTPYGGGPGMVMMVEPLRGAIKAAKATLGEQTKVIYLSPQGKRFDQSSASQLAKRGQLILLSGRYEGVDQRLIDNEVDEQWSIGDYVLSGGELAAMVMIDAMTRLLPGVLGNDESAQQDSFVNGLLDYPHYTRPQEVNSLRVPEVLQSGNHQAIKRWRLKQALANTWLMRPDLLEKKGLTDTEQQLLNEFIAEYQTTRSRT